MSKISTLLKFVGIVTIIIVSIPIIFILYLHIVGYFHIINRDKLVQKIENIKGVEKVFIIDEKLTFTSSVKADLKITLNKGKFLILNQVDENLQGDISLEKIGDNYISVYWYKLDGMKYVYSTWIIGIDDLSYIMNIDLTNLYDVIVNYEKIYEYIDSLPDNRSEKYNNIQPSNLFSVFDGSIGLDIHEFKDKRFVILKDTFKEF